MVGSYILLIKLPEEKTISVGSLKAIRFARDYYAYVGSAMGGYKSRLNRYLKRNKKPHWHIDYLLQEASITDIILCETEHRVECAIAQALNRRFDAVPGFGSSDCKCRSHLFFAAGGMRRGIIAIANSLGVKPRLAHNLDWETALQKHKR
ncbi:DUF123 domain-containing protein [Chloroflexota bacterium]